MSKKRIKNKIYKKYKRDINPKLEKLYYYKEDGDHLDCIRGAINNYENFLRRVRKINNKKLTEHVQYMLKSNLGYIKNTLEQYLI